MVPPTGFEHTNNPYLTQLMLYKIDDKSIIVIYIFNIEINRALLCHLILLKQKWYIYQMKQCKY